MPPDGLTCRELADFLSDYLEGELEGGIRERFEAHLEECPDCRAYLASFRDSVRLARESLTECDLPSQEVPPQLVAAILAARPRPR